MNSPAPSGSFRSLASDVAAVAELRWRMILNRFLARGGTAEFVARIAIGLFAIPTGIAFGIAAGTASHRALVTGGIGSQVQLMGLFYGLWQTWTVVGLALSQGFDLRRMLIYPIPLSRLWSYGLVGSVIGDPFAIVWSLMLAGAFVGAAIARPGVWLVAYALVLLLFVFATSALLALLHEVLIRLLRIRGMRIALIAAIYTIVTAIVTWLPGARLDEIFRGLRALRSIKYLPFPAGLSYEAVKALYDSRWLNALLWIALLVVAAGITAFAAYRLAIADAMSGGEGRVPGGDATRDWAIPGRLGPLIEKEIKFLLRHPLVSLFLILTPTFAAILGWRTAPLVASSQSMLRVLPLFGIALYSHLATQVFWLNAFGWDRGGARLFFLAPIDPGDSLRAKTIAIYSFSFLLFASASLALSIAIGAPPLWGALAALVLHLGVAPLLFTAGDAVSILNPHASPLTMRRAKKISPISGLASIAILFVSGAIFGIPFIFLHKTGSDWLLVAIWGAMATLGWGFHALFQPWLARLMVVRRDRLLEVVAGEEE